MEEDTMAVEYAWREAYLFSILFTFQSMFKNFSNKISRKFSVNLSVLSVIVKNQNSTVVKNELRNYSNSPYKIQSLKYVSTTGYSGTEVNPQC